MILMADGRSGLGPAGEIRAAGEVEGGGGGGEDLSMDLDTFLHILEESSDPSQVSFAAAAFRGLSSNFVRRCCFNLLECAIVL